MDLATWAPTMTAEVAECKLHGWPCGCLRHNFSGSRRARKLDESERAHAEPANRDHEEFPKMVQCLLARGH
jgi:hypothetical protein